MKRSESASASIPQHDYGLALKSAVSWLGDRYLLAEPMPRRRKEHKEYFVETRRWHDGRNAKAPLNAGR
ncbi:MAG TPA: hypothetical protein VFU13_20350 [Steroidobacteraceae bacterium]|nr:hypothetical protein [Steroidobacteraceae bacterium]